jgi:hypothetical protein
MNMFYMIVYGNFAIGPFQNKEQGRHWWKNQTQFASDKMPDDDTGTAGTGPTFKIFFVPQVLA